MRRRILIVAVSLALAVPVYAAPASDAPRASAILLEAESGKVIVEVSPDTPKPAGSFGQLMVLLLALERRAMENLPLDVPVAISPEAAQGRERTVVPLQTDQTYLLSDLMKATLLTAADTAARAVAEAVNGSLALSIEAMNGRAALLGMTNSRFSSIGGSSDENADRLTARDLGLLARELTRFPKVLEWSSLKGLPFDRGRVLLSNPNPLIGRVPGVDGLRLAPAGEPFSLIATARREGMRVIAVVLDAPDGDSCLRLARELIETGFDRYRRVELIRKGEKVKLTVDVAAGSAPSLVPVAGDSFSILMATNQQRRLSIRYQVPMILQAPVAENAPVGDLVIEDADGRIVGVVPLLNPEPIARTGLF